jgi:phage terminase large subunit GpA-like protein
MTRPANPRAVALRVIARVMQPPPPVDLNAWAMENITFGPESPFPGPYNPDRFPFFRRILTVLSPEHPATMAVMRKSAQLGGTVIAQIFAGAILDRAPQPVFYVHPTDGNAKKWKRNKFAKMVKGSPLLKGIMQPEGARTGNSAMYWSRRDGRGYLQLAGANSPSQLSMDSYPIAIHDDMAKWLADNGSGDPEVQADSRTKAFLTTGGKILKISTPDVQPGCRITRSWSYGTRERFHVPCPHCGALQALEWSNMLACLDEANPDDAHFTCVHCGERIEERHRDVMNRKGEWLAENPGAEIVSFYLWAAYSPLESWANIAKAWLRAKGNPEAERSFLNDNIGEAYQTATGAPDWEGLRDRAEAAGLPRGVVPRGMLMTTIGCDCQIDRIEWQVIAWGPRLQRVVIDFGIIHHHVSEEAAHRELNALVERTWPDSFGNRRPLDVLAIDGGAWTDDVHGWAKRCASSRVIVVKGARTDSAPPLARVKRERRPDGQIIKAQRRWFMVGVSGLKASLYANLKKDDPLELGFIGFVAGLEDEFYRELTSEVRKPIRLRDGSTEWRWLPMPGVDQEALDTHLYAQAAAIRAGWAVKSDEQWEELRRKLEVEPAPALLDIFTWSPELAPITPAATPSAQHGANTIRSRYMSG